MSPYAHALGEEIRLRIITESIPRIRKCLDQLNEEQIWYRPNANSNAVGNLVLHLCGNARQWLIHGLAEVEDIRNRDYEFAASGQEGKVQLLDHLERLEKDLTAAIPKIVAQDLLVERTVQQHFSQLGVSMIVHAIEHFSYHTGQITYITKMIKDIDTAYYGHLDL